MLRGGLAGEEEVVDLHVSAWGCARWWRVAFFSISH